MGSRLYKIDLHTCPKINLVNTYSDMRWRGYRTITHFFKKEKQSYRNQTTFKNSLYVYQFLHQIAISKFQISVNIPMKHF